MIPMKTKFFLTVILFSGFSILNSFGQEQRFKISLAEWSFHRALGKGEMTNLDFPKIAKTKYNLDAVEYVSTFFKGKAEDTVYLAKLKD